MSARIPSPFTRAGSGPGTARNGANTFGALLARFLSLAPALLVAVLCLRTWALWQGMPVGGWSSPDALRIAGYGLRDDLVWFLRGLPFLFLLSLPWLWLKPPRLRLIALGTLWSLWLLAQVSLEQYFLAARVPLGADLFGYSLEELRTSTGGAARLDPAGLAGWLLPLAGLWGTLALLAGRTPRSRTLTSTALLVIVGGLWFWPLRVPEPPFASDDAYHLALNKAGFFIADVVAQRARPAAVAPSRANNAAKTGDPATPDATPTDPDHPFLHPERTPDVLGPYFRDAAHPPHLVIILVEGLGRSFSGPDAPLGSFTPFLDELAGDSLYWTNFLANQGRTFAVLPSLFGSLPFGDNGVAALGERMPAHASLLNVLGPQGYRSRFYGGFDADFDNERLYLQRQGVRTIVDEGGFGPQYTRNPYSEWGFDDQALVSRVLEDVVGAGAPPTITVIQTMGMHTPYRFPRLPEFRRRFEQRLDALGIADADKPRYRQFGDIYASILYTDDALRRYFEAARRDPAHANTIYLVTGDHRLPEIPMDTRIERYHVPLLLHSPLLRAPGRIGAVASHLDIAPSLLAFLANRYGVQRPAEVTWTGEGLDMQPRFRSLRDIPLKQTKTALTDFVSERWYVSRGQVYELYDGMRIEPTGDPAGIAQVTARFTRYREANDRFAATLALAPHGDQPRLVAYDERVVEALPVSEPAGGVDVRDVLLPAEAEGATASATVEVSALFANSGDTPTKAIVPLLVLSADDGRQLREQYGPAFQLAAGATREVRFALKTDGLAPGRYFIALIPSHPDTGRPVGTGRYRIVLRVRG